MTSLEDQLQFAYYIIIAMWISTSAFTLLQTKESYAYDLHHFRHDRYNYRLTLLEAFLHITFAPVADWVNYLYMIYLNNKRRKVQKP